MRVLLCFSTIGLSRSTWTPVVNEREEASTTFLSCRSDFRTFRGNKDLEVISRKVLLPWYVP